jgi:hypothetical protein
MEDGRPGGADSEIALHNSLCEFLSDQTTHMEGRRPGGIDSGKTLHPSITPCANSHGTEPHTWRMGDPEGLIQK